MSVVNSHPQQFLNFRRLTCFRRSGHIEAVGHRPRHLNHNWRTDPKNIGSQIYYNMLLVFI